MSKDDKFEEKLKTLCVRNLNKEVNETQVSCALNRLILTTHKNIDF